jgi:hypothetical protein
MTPRLPLDIQFDSCAQGDDAGREHDGRRFPLKRVVDEVEPVVLPGAPTTGAAAAQAGAIANRLEDVRVAGAVLLGAAAQAEIVIEGRRLNWRPALAALEPLRRIIEACEAFEDALAATNPPTACASATAAVIAAAGPDGRRGRGCESSAARRDDAGERQACRRRRRNVRADRVFDSERNSGSIDGRTAPADG